MTTSASTPTHANLRFIVIGAGMAGILSAIWASGCQSWYLDQSGLPTAWPWTFDRFREEMAKPRFADYEMRAHRGVAA